MKKNNLFILFIILFVCLFVYKDWLLFHILKGGEWQYYYPEGLLSKLKTGMWMSSETLGNYNNVIIYRLPMEIVLGFFGYFKLDSRFADFFVFYLPIILGFPLIAYFSGKYLFKFKLAAIILLVCAFSFNTYFLFINTAGHLHINVASVAGFSGLMLYINSLRNKKKVYLVLSAISLFVSGVYDFRPTYLSIFIIFLYTNYHLFSNFSLYQVTGENKITKILERIFLEYKYFGIELLIIIMLFAYWILPTVSTNTVSESISVNKDIFGVQFFDIIQSFTLHHPYWNGLEPISFVKNNSPLLFWTIPIFSLLGLIVNRRKKIIIFFAIVSLFGIFLTKQTSEPFPTVYEWLFLHIPGFNAFRESSKFFFLTVLGYGVLISSFVDYLWSRNYKHAFFVKIKWIITFFLIFLFLFNTKPIFTGEIKTMFVPRNINNDYYIFKNFIENQKEYFRVLWVPTVSSWSPFTNIHPKISEVADFVTFYSGSQGGAEEKLVSLFDIQGIDDYLNETSVKYVVVPIKDNEDDDNPFYYYGNDRNKYIQKLDKIKYLKRINIGTTDLVVYEITYVKPHIYSSFDRESMSNKIPYSKVFFREVSPTQYIVNLKQVSKPLYINISEIYNDNWKIRIGNFNWLKAMYEDKYFINNINHIQNSAKFNSFLIDPINMCKTYTCSLNKDGSYDIDLSIFFKPQSYFYLGLLISGTTLSICIIFLANNLIKIYKSHA